MWASLQDGSIVGYMCWTGKGDDAEAGATLGGQGGVESGEGDAWYLLGVSLIRGWRMPLGSDSTLLPWATTMGGSNDSLALNTVSCGTRRE